LEQKKEDSKLIRAGKYEDSTQKYVNPKSEAWHGPCHYPHGCAMSQDFPFVVFALWASYLLVYFWPKSPWFLMEHSSDVFLRA